MVDTTELEVTLRLVADVTAAPIGSASRARGSGT